MKPKGFNRNISGGKRPHKGISSMPKECINNLAKRIRFESNQSLTHRAFRANIL